MDLARETIRLMGSNCFSRGIRNNGIARTLKNYAHQRETTRSSSDPLQLRPFSKWELLLKERICSQSERIISFKSSSLLN